MSIGETTFRAHLVKPYWAVGSGREAHTSGAHFATRYVTTKINADLATTALPAVPVATTRLMIINPSDPRSHGLARQSDVNGGLGPAACFKVSHRGTLSSETRASILAGCGT